MKRGRLVVVGAGGAVGFEIVRALRARGADVLATYRTERDDLKEQLREMGAEPCRLDLADDEAVRNALVNAAGAIFTPILTLSIAAAKHVPAGARAIFFSSNNVAIDPEAPVYKALAEAEDLAQAAAPDAMILRPAMIYGYPGDGNMSRQMLAMRRWPLMPLPGRAGARQQPVYYRDLAETAADLIIAEDWSSETLAVAGPRPLTQQAVFHAVRRAGRAGALIPPFGVSSLAGPIRLLERAGLKLPVSSAQLARANMDKAPQGPTLLTGTSLEDGLKSLADALDGKHDGA